MFRLIYLKFISIIDSNMLKKLYFQILNRPLLYLIIYGLIWRVFVLIFYNGITIYPDSAAYIELSKLLSNFSLENYTGERTPGYPILIALAAGNLNLTVFIQTVLGLISIVLIYDFSKLNTKNKALSFWISIIFASFLHIIFFEFAILTETLSLFFVLLSFWYIKKYNLIGANASLKHAFVLSIILSFLYVTRPIFIYFPTGFFLFYLVKNFSYGFKRIIFKATVFIILPFLSYYTWCSINEKNIGYFASTYFLGVNLSQTATPFFEKVPDENKLIRDIVVKHRELNPMYKSDKKNPMSVWFAWNELREKTNLSNPDLSNELGRISVNLFKEYPHLYLNQVFISWKDFWGSSLFFWRTENFNNKLVEKWTYRLWYSCQQYLLILVNLLFILFSIKKIVSFIKSKFKVFDTDLFVVAIIISGSLAQALVVYGSNSRFCVPFFPLIVYFVISNLYSSITLKKI